MTNRVFRKDQDAVNAINNLGFATAQFAQELLIRVMDYSDLTTLQKTTVTSTLSGFNYSFAYDDG